MTFKYEAENKGTVLVQSYIDGISSHTFKLNKPNTIFAMPIGKSNPLGKAPIKKSKLQDIEKLVSYITHEFQPWHDDLKQWPSVDGEEEEEGDEIF